MNSSKKTQLVNSGDTRILVASLNYPRYQCQDMITWKKKVYTADEVKKNPLRLLFAIKDNGVIHSYGKELFATYEFTQADIGKYIKFYSYNKEFNALTQCLVFYVEDKCSTNVRIRGVERVGSDSSEATVGQKIKLKVNQYSVEEKKVSTSIKRNIKWMVKVGSSEDERLIIDGVVMTGEEIEFEIPREWSGENIVLMPYFNKHTPDYSVKVNVVSCQHSDGAIEVAEYIVNEIKTNTKSNIAGTIRYYASYEEYKKRYEEWRKRNLLGQILSPPEPQNLLKAKALWTERVFAKRPWDHKPKIKEKFGHLGVERTEYSNITKKMVTYKSYYHKYMNYDYYYDVWSNIHYGYVGLSVGFDENTLLNGADLAQIIDSSGSNAEDTADDKISVKIGFALYYKYGQYAESLTAKDILDALDSAKMTDSKKEHVCLQK